MFLRKMLSNKNNLDIKIELEYCLNIYNNKNHSSIKFKPYYLIKSKDEKEWNNAKINNNKN